MQIELLHTLKDKIIIVTGGSGLIGKEIVADIKRKVAYAKKW